jgi:hypothetical protein
MGVWKVCSCFLNPYGEGFSSHTEGKANINTAQDGERKTDEDRATLVVKPDAHTNRLTKGSALSGTIHRF